MGPLIGSARRIEVDGHRVIATDKAGAETVVAYDAVVIATGAEPVRPPIGGLDQLGPADGVHVLHTMGDTFEVMQTIERVDPRSAVIVGAATADDHKAYYPGAKTIHIRITGDTATGRLLGVQYVGERATAVHKRIDAAAAAIFAGLTLEAVNDLDLSYTPPLGSPWDVLQAGSQTWLRQHRTA